MTTHVLPLTLAAFVACAITASAQHGSMPPGMTHEEHLAQMQREADMKQRGAASMGFDQDLVAHHFLLSPDGGTIRVEVKDAAETASRDAIRTHLREIATQFAAGNFEAPFATHAETPPGVPVMQKLKSTLRYTFSERAGGGEVRITTTDGDALRAVHEFLRYQIEEHHSNDPLTFK